MTRLSSLVGGGGPHYSDPRRMPRQASDAGNIALIRSGPGRDIATGSLFWSWFGTRNGQVVGANVDTDFMANTYKTVLNVSSGAGFLSAIVGPTSGGAETTTFRITVDGVVYTIAVGVGATTRRAILGFVASPNFAGQDTTSSPDYRLNTEGDPDVNTGGTFQPMTVHRALSRGVGLLRFNTSLLVEIAHSENVTGTANQERRCGLFYRLDA